MKTVIFEDVLYIESLGDYVKIHLQNNEKIITKEKISSLEKRLPNSFIRIHRSFIVNKYRASTLTKESLMVGEQLLPISRTYKQQAWSKLTDE